MATNVVRMKRSPWAERICQAWQKSVSGILETGSLLCQAQAEVSHGKWLELVQSELPFGERTAQRLMEISKSPQLSNPTLVSHLPASWGTLYELSKLDDEEWEEAEERGLIQPDTTRRQIHSFKKSLEEPPKRPGPKRKRHPALDLLADAIRSTRAAIKLVEEGTDRDFLDAAHRSLRRVKKSLEGR